MGNAEDRSPSARRPPELDGWDELERRFGDESESTDTASGGVANSPGAVTSDDLGSGMLVERPQARKAVRAVAALALVAALVGVGLVVVMPNASDHDRRAGPELPSASRTQPASDSQSDRLRPPAPRAVTAKPRRHRDRSVPTQGPSRSDPRPRPAGGEHEERSPERPPAPLPAPAAPPTPATVEPSPQPEPPTPPRIEPSGGGGLVDGARSSEEFGL